jgi:imidazolonepropionase
MPEIQHREHGATLILGISELTTNAPDAVGADPIDPSAGSGESDPTGLVRDAALLLDGDGVAWAGPAADCADAVERVLGRPPDRVVDVEGRAVIPGFVDSHSHLAFAGDRSAEFEARMAGRPYAAGGIRTTVAATRAASDDVLRATLRRHVDQARAQGTTTLEVKSGYGLTVADEERSARLAREVTDEVTFLGAHVVPPEFDGRADDYVDLVCGDMLAACAPHARWVDVFCETGAFTPEQSRRVLSAGSEAGLGVRGHANQLGPGEGVRLAVDLGAAAVDHCTYLSDDDVAALAASWASAPGGAGTVATLLPPGSKGIRIPRSCDVGRFWEVIEECMERADETNKALGK